MERLTTPLVEWGMASRAIAPGQVTADLCLVRESPHGVLIAAVDGVGHGPEAVSAAQRAIDLIASAEVERPIDVVRLCHPGLRGTRGVVMSLAWFDAARDTLTWLGVGNVAGMLVRLDPTASPRTESLLCARGVVGRQMPIPRAEILSVAHGDTLVLATDGVRPQFASDLSTLGTPQAVADRILAAHATGADDALVVVARYRGGAA
ncbi:MAG TPA: SpoIIE family protein phosphatase [Candidatus Eisenbacteria bacterium]|jgi:hypothetical protein